MFGKTHHGEVHPVDEVLPLPKMTLYGLQHVLRACLRSG